MPNPREAKLLTSLPAAAAKAVRRAFTSKSDPVRWRGVEAALASVDFPRGSVFPLASSLTAAQRALAEILAYRELTVPPDAMPRSLANRRHWLGGGGSAALLHAVTFEHDKQRRTEPLWRVVQMCGSKALALVPVDVAARAYADIWQELELPWYVSWKQTAEMGWFAFDHVNRRLEAQAKPWIASYADQVLAAARAKPKIKIPTPVRWITFVGLVRAKVTIEPRWDVLLPVEGTSLLALTRECLRALPVERRGRALVAGLQSDTPYENVDVALRLLKEAPSKDVAEWIVANAELATGMTKRDVLAKLAKVKIVETRAVSEAASKKLPPIQKLTYVKRLRPTRVGQLDAMQQKQLAAAGESYDGQRMSAAARLAKVDEHETSFRGSLEVGQLVDEKGEAVYDALLYMRDSGTILRAGTTKKVADIIQDGVEASNESVTDAIEQALTAPRRRT